MLTKLLILLVGILVILLVPVCVAIVISLTYFVCYIIMIFNPKVYNNWFGPIDDRSQ